LDEETRRRINGLEYESIDALMQIRRGQEEYIDSILAEQGWTEEQINKYKRLRKAMDAANNTWKGVMSNAKQTLSDIKGAYEAMNDGAQSITLEMLDAGIALADASYQMVELLRNFKKFKKEAPGLGAALNTALGIIGLIATAVQTIINVINMIASSHDESLEGKIKQYEKQVDKLADAYDRLSEKIQKAYSFARLTTSTSASMTNLQKQINAYENMIAAERDKKDSDQDRIDEWAKKVSELKRNMKDIQTSAVVEAGGLGGEYKTAAQGFVDAWMQAFRETGNGLDALNKHFEDFLWDIAGKQVLLQVADKFFEPLFEELDKRMTDYDTSYYDEQINSSLKEIENRKESLRYLNNLYARSEFASKESEEKFLDKIRTQEKEIQSYKNSIATLEEQRAQAIMDALMLDEDDFNALRKIYEQKGMQFEQWTQAYLAGMGFKGGSDEDMLSGLQKGIQGITESTAEIIEAYLNSVRFFVSDSNQKLTELLERFASADGTRSPILAELRAQTSYLNSIDKALSTIIDPSGWRNGGGVLKVMM
jgi:chromosome segregation ATPase